MSSYNIKDEPAASVGKAAKLKQNNAERLSRDKLRVLQPTQHTA